MAAPKNDLNSTILAATAIKIVGDLDRTPLTNGNNYLANTWKYICLPKYVGDCMTTRSGNFITAWQHQCKTALHVLNSVTLNRQHVQMMTLPYENVLWKE